MNVVKISPNWTLQLIKITLALLITYILSIATPMEFKSVGIIIFPLFLVISLFNIMQLRFLHCYKAGINYSRGVGKQYINADEIKSLSFRRYAIITEFCVVTLTGQSHRFINWQISKEQNEAICHLYEGKCVSADK
ncbi:hypothetical protein [Pseudoalteromonas sp. H105]|jgi:hypothetical protein|uniref:hypothetical protein n=1 Tax=Pseudoalteromonas sp. H105 TaxID=1348393 RepID=UPI0007321509|nr:hypothetical protein [Pseudoalteromonas sp. H105]KTF13732.1 hypothetical protein ATS75_14265 [Pseudoalteromonas sp. H105]